MVKGKSKFTLTGQLGDVMKESAQAALTYIRSRAEELRIADDYFDNHEFHLHIPEGAIPKDGPSAGMAMALAIMSLITRRPVRHDVAMTGEITLRGEVYAIGGLNEKLLAAQRNRIAKVLIPRDNLKDLSEIPEKVKEGLTIIAVSTVEEALPHIFPVTQQTIECLVAVPVPLNSSEYPAYLNRRLSMKFLLRLPLVFMVMTGLSTIQVQSLVQAQSSAQSQSPVQAQSTAQSQSLVQSPNSALALNSIQSQSPVLTQVPVPTQSPGFTPGPGGFRAVFCLPSNPDSRRSDHYFQLRE